MDTVSIASSNPAATTIKVPYKQTERFHEILQDEVEPRNRQTIRKRQREPDQLLDLVTNKSKSFLKDNEHKVETSGENLTTDSNASADHIQKPHYDYRTIIANVQASPIPPKQQVISAYNVKVIKHNSPFNTELKPVTSVSDLSSSIARLELLSSELSASKLITDSSAVESGSRSNNNNSSKALDLNAPSDISQLIVDSKSDTRRIREESDRVSIVSSSSLRSSRTYDIRSSELSRDEIDLDDESHFPVERANQEAGMDESDQSCADKDEARPTAWIFNPESGTSTTIKAPPKPPKPELPKVDSKELAESRGGRSYYLEVVEPNKERSASPRRARLSSIDSLYSRSNSHSTLSSSNQTQPSGMQRKPLASSSYQLTQTPRPAKEIRKSRPTSGQINHRARSSSAMRDSSRETAAGVTLPQTRSPSGSILSKSKSSSCLAVSARPSKYSIYGGLRKPGEKNKPVPRLSYSRAIGPKSQRQLDAQSKTPSRYLKMR